VCRVGSCPRRRGERRPPLGAPARVAPPLVWTPPPGATAGGPRLADAAVPRSGRCAPLPPARGGGCVLRGGGGGASPRAPLRSSTPSGDGGSPPLWRRWPPDSCRDPTRRWAPAACTLPDGGAARPAKVAGRAALRAAAERHKDCIWNGSPDESTVHGPTGQNARVFGLPFPDGSLNGRNSRSGKSMQGPRECPDRNGSNTRYIVRLRSGRTNGSTKMACQHCLFLTKR